MNKHHRLISQASPGKNDNFHPIYLLHLLQGFRTVSDFVLYCKLVHPS